MLVEINQSNMRADIDRSFWKLSDIENEEVWNKVIGIKKTTITKLPRQMKWWWGATRTYENGSSEQLNMNSYQNLHISTISNFFFQHFLVFFMHTFAYNATWNDILDGNS